MNTQSMPSLLYSSCSSTNMWWLKNCCNFSLVKLMQSCSKPLNCRFLRHVRACVGDIDERQKEIGGGRGDGGETKNHLSVRRVLRENQSICYKIFKIKKCLYLVRVEFNISIWIARDVRLFEEEFNLKWMKFSNWCLVLLFTNVWIAKSKSHLINFSQKRTESSYLINFRNLFCQFFLSKNTDIVHCVYICVEIFDQFYPWCTEKGTRSDSNAKWMLAWNRQNENKMREKVIEREFKVNRHNWDDYTRKQWTITLIYLDKR